MIVVKGMIQLSEGLFACKVLAYLIPQALHNSLGPLGPFRHSGESVQ